MQPHRKRRIWFCLMGLFFALSSCSNNEVDRIDQLADYYSKNYPSPKKDTIVAISENGMSSPQSIDREEDGALSEKAPLTFIAEISVNVPGTMVMRAGQKMTARAAGSGLIANDTLITPETGGANVVLEGEERFVSGVSTSVTVVGKGDPENRSFILELRQGAVYLRPRSPDSRPITLNLAGYQIDPGSSSCIARLGEKELIVAALDGPIIVYSERQDLRVVVTAGKQMMFAEGADNSARQRLLPGILTDFELDAGQDFNKYMPAKSAVNPTLEAIAFLNLKNGVPRTELTTTDNREIKDYFITFRPIYKEADPYYHSVGSFGWFWDTNMSIGIELNRGYGSSLSGVDVTAQSLSATRVGGVYRRYFGNSFNAFFTGHYTYLAGNLTFSDPDLSASNSVRLSSHTLSAHFGVGNQFISEGGVIIGLDWLISSLPLIHTYSLSFSQNGSGTAATSLAEQFSSNTPVLLETYNTAVLLLYVGYAF